MSLGEQGVLDEPVPSESHNNDENATVSAPPA